MRLRSWGRRAPSTSVRRTSLLPLCLLIVLAAVVPMGLTDAPANAGEKASGEQFRSAVAFAKAKVYPCLVNISVIARQFTQGREYRGLSAGSGVIVSPAGYVVTNFHVAGDASRITCGLPNGERIEADIVCADPLTDLCVIKLRMAQRPDPNLPLPFATIGDSRVLQAGDHVMAMGNPMGLKSTVTLGIVSNTSRVFTNFAGSAIQDFDFGGGQVTGIFNQWIQHDALILPGNSGGPLVNMKGEVVGINTRGGSGTAFAIPGTTVQQVLNQALTFGEVRRGWIGVSVLPVRGLDRKDGALVSSVYPGGPADKAGIKPGDIIFKIGGKRADVRDLEDVPLFLSLVAAMPADKAVAIEFERDGDLRGEDVTVARMEKFIGKEEAFRIWGVTAMSITKPMAFNRRYPDTKGVVLTSVRPGSAPDKGKPSLNRGDVILEIGGKQVENIESFRKLMHSNRKNKALSVRFRRGKRDMVTVLDMSKPPKPPRNTELAKAWIGIRTQVLTTKVAKALGLEGKKGLRVTWILPGTEVEKSDLKPGDVITALNGEPLDAYRQQDAEVLVRRVEDLDIGSEAKLSVLRDGKPVEVTVPLEENPQTAEDPRSAEDPVLEYKVKELTFIERINRELDKDYQGLMVASVTSGSWAQVANLRVGDILLEINDEPVKTIREFKKLVRKLGKEKPARVKIFVKRGQATAFVFMRPEWPKD